MGTISSHQKISVTHSTGCTALYECTGNLNPAFYFPPLTNVKYEIYWTSSIGNHSLSLHNPLYLGRSGYNCINTGAHFVSYPHAISFQRPALYIFDN